MGAAANYKIVFTGPVGAGKTTAIAALSDIPPITTDEAATDMTGNRKPTTTVALDYGIMRLPGRQRIHLYGTPGQERFDFMWEILVEGGIGLVLLLDGTRPAPHKDMLFFLDAFREFITRTSVVIGVTRLDLVPDVQLDDLRTHLAATGLNPPLFTVDARRRSDVQTLVKALLYTIDPGLTDHATI
jgi:signal recognition particle receptor subunit beta